MATSWARDAGMLVVVAALAGCASAPPQGTERWRETDVTHRRIEHAPAGRYELEPEQGFALPVLRHAPTPGFPDGFDPVSLPPTTLCASMAIDARAPSARSA
jgi:hypothetical protein